MTTATPRTTLVKNEFTLYLRISQLPKSVQSVLLVSEQQAKYVTPAFNSKWKWFSTSPYWHRRGREGQSELRADSFGFEVDEDYCPYPRVNVDEATKNHPGGIIDLQSSKNLGEWTYQIPMQRPKPRRTIVSEEVYFQKNRQPWSFLPVSETKRSWRVLRCLVWKQTAWRGQTPKHDERHFQGSRIIADL